MTNTHSFKALCVCLRDSCMSSFEQSAQGHSPHSQPHDNDNAVGLLTTLP